MLSRESRVGARWMMPFVLALVGAATLVASPSATQAAWDGIQTVHLGDSITAEFTGAPLAEEHKYSFYAVKDTVLSTSIKVDASAAGLVPELKLFTHDDVAVNLGATQVGNLVKNFKFTTTGEYYIRLRATAGTGSYRLATKVKIPASLSGATTTGTFAFDAGNATVFGATAKKSKGSTAVPKFTGLTYNGGTVALGAAANTAKIAKLVLPVNATYTLAINPGTAGQSVDVKLTFAAPKPKTWSFGHIEDTSGLASQNRAKWLTSGHADKNAVPFTHWDTLSPPVIPTSCARCHSTPGYRDYLGADGTAVGVVDNPAPIGTTVECDACHNDKTLALTSVTFPSGLTVSGLGKEARCMVCHQGRESTLSLEAAINTAAVTTKITNDETAATGILGTDVKIVAGTTFTDTGAGFITAIGTVDNPSTYFLTMAALSTDLNGTAGVISTKNIGMFQITAATADTVTLATAMVAETPAVGKSFQYKVVKVSSPDTSVAALNFLNVHYFAAGASLYGRQAAGAYEYVDPTLPQAGAGVVLDTFLPTLTQRNGYDIKFTHVASKDTCIQCHDPHSLAVKVSECATCHVNKNGVAVSSNDDLRDIRMAGSTHDYNGDGDLGQGIWYEIKGPAGLEAKLLAAIQDYATKVVGTSISYDGTTYPYFFVQGTSNKYASWTPRLLRAAYNYQFSVKDPGSFAHNAKYIIEVLYDSIADLNAKNAVANFANLARNDPGHFDSDEQAYRHWDAGGGVDASCARCHSIDGFQFVAAYNVDPTVAKFDLISGLSCETCHVEGTSFAPQSINPNADKKPARIYVASVTFPITVQPTATSGTASTIIPSTQAQISAVTIFNGAAGSASEDNSFICMTCHRARESKLTLDAADPTGATTNFTLSFKNSHYLGAGASQYGSKAAVMYQYPTKTYVQRYDHNQAYTNAYPATVAGSARCEYCHMGVGIAGVTTVGDHDFKYFETGPNETLPAGCTSCHSGSTTAATLTPAFRAEDNYDNDPTTKPKAELGVFQSRLLATVQAYCKTKTDAAVTGANYVVYDGSTYPYFIVDTNKDGVRQPTESGSPKFDTKTFRATFNYNFSIKEPGSWAHNPKYVLQILYDAIVDLGGDVTGLTRP